MKRVGQHSDIKNCPFRAVATYQEGREALRHQAEENFPAMEKATESLTQDNHSRQSLKTITQDNHYRQSIKIINQL